MTFSGSLNSDHLLSRKVQINVLAFYVYHFRSEILAFVFTYIIKTRDFCLTFGYVNKKSSHANPVRIIVLRFITFFW